MNRLVGGFKHFFPRASERRVLPIVGVCISSSHLHTFSSSHLLIFTSSYLHIFSSSHLLIFTSLSSHTHTFSFSLSLSLALTPSHTHIFSLSLSLSSFVSAFFLSFLSPFSLSLSLAFFIFLSLGRGWCRRGVTKREPFRTKWGSRSAKTEVKIAILLAPEQPFRTKWGSIGKNWATVSHEMRVDRQKLR